jgi:hypothetical protein
MTDNYENLYYKILAQSSGCDAVASEVAVKEGEIAA